MDRASAKVVSAGSTASAVGRSVAIGAGSPTTADAVAAGGSRPATGTRAVMVVDGSREVGSPPHATAARRAIIALPVRMALRSLAIPTLPSFATHLHRVASTATHPQY